MDIYEAIKRIEDFAEGYGEQYHGTGKWAPAETRIVPSGDDKDHIKIWFNLGAGVDGDQLASMHKQFEHDLAKAEPGLSDYTLEIRMEAFE